LPDYDALRGHENVVDLLAELEGEDTAKKTDAPPSDV
jgi:hypothetical protein